MTGAVIQPSGIADSAKSLQIVLPPALLGKVRDIEARARAEL